ncbi:MAG: aminotransferase class V-fold PLP-dependent enzyme [Dethiosulfovibrio sp.]|nr:aminotransferase class V-fold PLP-dependent enzyme [Dethiosulfovibrio sp.]
MSTYMNNAATSWPKPDPVPKAVFDFMVGRGANLARGAASGRDLDTMDMVIECREWLGRTLGGYRDGDPRYISFTANITESLNVVLKGYLKPGMTVATTSMEHNAVIRPLRRLEKKGVKVEVMGCDGCGKLDPDVFRALCESKKVDMLVMSHGSNLCGAVQDVDSLSRICGEKDIHFVLDTAQTAGVIPISASKLGLAALCFTGHKGLMGPQGIGGIVWKPSFAELCEPFVEGGTGSFSHEEHQPESMPDKFESGTPNLPGIAGLLAALKWIDEIGIDVIHKREEELGSRLLEGLKSVPGIVFHGSSEMDGRLPVFAVNFEGMDNGVIAGKLADMGIETRPGLHCAPLAHRTLGSFPQGALRLSVGFFSTEEQVDMTLKAIKQVAEEG